MPPSFTSLKTVIRCADYQRSREFYAGLLGLPVSEEWEEPQGRGCVMRVGDALLEFYEMTTADARFKPEFRDALSSDKIDLQIKTPDVDEWAEYLRGRCEFKGPEVLPWGQKWIQLRDPDNLLIAIYEDPQ